MPIFRSALAQEIALVKHMIIKKFCLFKFYILGQKFAMLHLKTVIAKIVLKYKLLPAVPHVELNLIPELVLKSKSGICLKLERRK